MKTRLLGAAVLIALAVLFVPMFFSSSPPSVDGDQTVSLAIPPAPDRDLQTRTMDLRPDAPAGNASAPLIPARQTVSSNQLATVDIVSRRPADMGTEPADKAPAAAEAPAAAAPEPTSPPSAPPDAATPSAPVADTAGTAAQDRYSLNLSAYANAGSAKRLIGKVKALGYPVSGQSIQQSGQSLTLVTAGPFATRTAAEAARLKITQAVPGAPARMERSASDQQGDVPAQPAKRAAPAAKAAPGGFAVQVAAVSQRKDALVLRDKLRAAGFDSFIDSVDAGGQDLWRVRAGPMANRDDATRVRDQVKTKLGLSGNVVSVP